MCRYAAGSAPVATRYARMPSLNTVPRTCAAATMTNPRQAPKATPTVPSPTSASSTHQPTVPAVRNAETTSAPIGWSGALARLVLAQSSQRARTGAGWACRATVPRTRPAAYPRASPYRSARRTQRISAPPAGRGRRRPAGSPAPAGHGRRSPRPGSGRRARRRSARRSRRRRSGARRVPVPPRSPGCRGPRPPRPAARPAAAGGRAGRGWPPPRAGRAAARWPRRGRATSRPAPNRPRWPRRSRPAAVGSPGQRYRVSQVLLGPCRPVVEVGGARAGQPGYLRHPLVAGAGAGAEQDRDHPGRRRVRQVRAPGDRAAGDLHLRVRARVGAVEGEVVAAAGERVAEEVRRGRVLVPARRAVVEVREPARGVPVRRAGRVRGVQVPDRELPQHGGQVQRGADGLDVEQVVVPVGGVEVPDVAGRVGIVEVPVVLAPLVEGDEVGVVPDIGTRQEPGDLVADVHHRLPTGRDAHRIGVVQRIAHRPLVDLPAQEGARVVLLDDVVDLLDEALEGAGEGRVTGAEHPGGTRGRGGRRNLRRVVAVLAAVLLLDIAEHVRLDDPADRGTGGGAGRGLPGPPWRPEAAGHPARVPHVVVRRVGTVDVAVHAGLDQSRP